MIEFIIPLNLPVRAVEVTATTGKPSARILNEMARWAAGAASPHASAQNDNSLRSGQSQPSATIADLEQERQSLIAQRELFSQAVDELKKATKLAEQRLNGMLLEFQEVSVELAHAIAAKLIFEEVDANRFPIANLVHETVSRLNRNTSATVQLHPDDLKLIQEHPSIEESNETNSLRFVADANLARGDCRAKAGEINVIYELRRQVDEIRRELLSTVSGHAEARN